MLVYVSKMYVEWVREVVVERTPHAIGVVGGKAR